MTRRGKSGASVLARPPRQITLLDIYRASPAFAIHSYLVEKRCPISCSLKERMSGFFLKLRGEVSRENNLGRSGCADTGKDALTFFVLNCATDKNNKQEN